MKLRKYVFLALLAGSSIISQYALSAPMEGVDEAEVSSEEGNKRASNVIPVIALLIGISGAGVGIMSILKVNKTDEEIKKLKKAYSKDIETAKSEISNLRNSVSNFKIQLSDTKADINRWISSHNFENAVRTNLREDSSNVNPARPQMNQQNKPQNSVPVRQYFGTPNQGVFSNPSQNYVAGKTLYYIQSNTGENSGQYYYSDNAEAASIAAR